MAPLDATAVAALLAELGRRTALSGDNYFRAKAYLRAADTLSALLEPLDQVIAENRLRELPGIGETIADISPSCTGLVPIRFWNGCARTSRQACSTCCRSRV